MPDGQKGPNGLWIVDLAGLNHYPEMSIPRYGYAREEITPGMEGNITIEQMDPVGKVRTFGMGYVRPYHVYKMWFYGDVPGTHMIRYNINGYYSNIVRFYILKAKAKACQIQWQYQARLDLEQGVMSSEVAEVIVPALLR